MKNWSIRDRKASTDTDKPIFILKAKEANFNEVIKEGKGERLF